MCHACNLRDPRLDPILHELIEFPRVHLAGHTHTEHRDFIERDLGHRRLFRIGRELRQNRINLPRCVLHDKVDVCVLLELDDDKRHALERCRPDVVDLVNSRDGVLNDLGDVILHFIGRRAGIDRRDCHHGNGHLRKQLVPELIIPKQAEDRQHGKDHNNECWAFYR